VHDRFAMCPRGAVTPARLVAALAEEMRVADRSAAGSRSIGFRPPKPPLETPVGTAGPPEPAAPSPPSRPRTRARRTS
jgi:hypothetical protein